MKYHIVHTTRYAGSEPVSVGHNEAWLTPRSTDRQRCIAHRLRIHPEPSIKSTRVDYFGNTVTQFSFNEGYAELDVTADSEVELTPVRPPDDPGPPWEDVAALLAGHSRAPELAAYEFTFDSPCCRTRPEFAAYARESFTPRQPLLTAARSLMQRIRTEFQYDATATSVSTPVEQAFRLRRGVCQDFAHLMISMLRSLGLAARYVSGYLRTTSHGIDAPLIGADASHAWLALYCGPLDWIDFDPTNNLIPYSDHITIAWGRDYSDVAPLKGVYIGGGTLHLKVGVDVRPFAAAPTPSTST